MTNTPALWPPVNGQSHSPKTSAWGAIATAITPEQKERAVNAAVEALQGLPINIVRDRAELATRARAALGEAARLAQLNLPSAELTALTQQVVARVGGLGFLHPLLPPLRNDLAEIAVNPDGRIWVLPKGRRHFEALDLTATPEEIWRAVEALLTPLGRAVSEAAPSVDAKLPREEGFGGARIKVLHPVVVPGRGPSINIRLFEARPVPPQQLVDWNAAPATVMQTLLDAVRRRARVLVIGGTATGKTTWVSALANGIPTEARIVKIEDPEEIYLSNPNVVTIEARPATPGSSVPPYTIRNGVDDAMRLSPHWLIVGEVRTGDAALALFRAQMSDHPGLSTFHAESPEEAVFRMSIIMFADARVDMQAAKAIFGQAIDLVIQVGWLNGRRCLLGVSEVMGLNEHGDVLFAPRWQPGQTAMTPLQRLETPR